MKTSRTDNQCCNFIIKSVRFSLFINKINFPVNSISQINLPGNTVFPGWRIAVFEICHKSICAGIKSIDNHFAIHRTCDFHSSVQQIFWQFRTSPITFSYSFGLFWKSGQFSFIKFLLNFLSLF